VLPECRLLKQSRDGARLGIHLTDLLGPCFTALRFDADQVNNGDAWQQLQNTLAGRGIPFNVIDIVTAEAQSANRSHAIDPTGRLHDMLDAQPGTVYLIRPDGHVLARWRNGSAAAVLHALDATLTQN
jgi:3-(3-hydroxy-phenyl)propionate hydroxylase